MKHLPNDWLLGQQIGVLAYALSQFDVDLLAEDQDARSAWIEQLREKLQEFDSFNIPQITLPLSALYTLSKPEFLEGLPEQDRQSFSKWSNRYKDAVTGRWDTEGTPRPSQINGAKLLAHQILYGDARPKAIGDAAVAFLSERFTELTMNVRLQETTQQILQILRGATKPTEDLIEAVSDICRPLSALTPAALLIRNALLDHVLAWPIIVFGKPDARPIGSISLPIGVNFSFDGKSQVIPIMNRVRGGNQDVVVDGWMGYLRRATEVGKALWRAKNGSAGEWRDQLLASSVTFDFTAIEDIMGGTPLRAVFTDRSMEAYFAQVVLAKAIGRHAGFTAAISGYIGRQRTIITKRPVAASENESPPPIGSITTSASGVEEELEDDNPPVLEEQVVLDWHFEWPQGVRAKKSYVYNSMKFDRFVLPPNPKDFSDDPGISHAYVETNHSRFLSDVADCVQTGGWRQFKYVRCPDLSQVLHRYPEELPAATAPEVSDSIALLAASEHAVIDWPEHKSPSALFAGLHHLNFVQRLNDARPSPSLSWLAIRSLPGNPNPEETDSRFWHLVLKSMGASRDYFERLRLAESPDIAATLLADALNCLTCDERTRGERSPDLLILLACDNLATAEDNDLLAETRPLAFRPVMECLKRKLVLPVFDRRMQEFIGATRCIVVNSDCTFGNHAPTSERLSQDDKETLQRLRTFRYGFTQQMATVVLQNHLGEPPEVRTKLKELLRLGFLSYGGGWYRVRSAYPTDEVIKNRSDLAMANSHFFSALSFAPYLLKQPVPGLNIAEALLPANVREAIHHFESAARFANRVLNRADGRKESATSIRHQSRIAQQRIIRFFDIPTLGVVNALAKNRALMPCRETYELAQEVIADRREHGQTVGSHSLTTLARATTQLWREIRQQPDKSAEADALYEEIVEAYEEALVRASAAPRFTDELRLSVLTRYAAFLHRFATTDDTRQRRHELDQEILSLLNSGVVGYAMYGEWFALHGDEISDPARALEIYRMGVTHVPNYHANFPRWVGAAVLANSPPREIQSAVNGIDPDKLLAVVEWAKDQTFDKRIDFRKRRYVVQRFNAGKASLERHLRALGPISQRSTPVAGDLEDNSEK